METPRESWSIDRLKARLERVEGEVAQLREGHQKLQQLLFWCAVLILAALIFGMGIAEHRAEERARQPTAALQAGAAVQRSRPPAADPDRQQRLIRGIGESMQRSTFSPLSRSFSAKR
jgi:hypothetical protein